MDVTVQDMLLAREQRVRRQQELLAEFQKPLICFSMNIPGPEKNSPLYTQGFHLGIRRLYAQLEGEGIPLLHKETVCGHTGYDGFFVADAPAEQLKALCIQIEEADSVGRLFDMDVLTADCRKLQRKAPRKCLLCGEQAQVCGRSRRHSVEELQQETHRRIRQALELEDRRRIAAAAVKALLYEVAVTPKPGLVDREGPGSHRDMDIFTFLGSASVLQPYFEDCARLGQANCGLPQLRYPGKLAEQAMRQETGGVNTHKGAIFSLGILCAAAGQLGTERTSQAILARCAQLSAGLTAELGQKTGTAGQRLFEQHGITGIRGQAEQGFPAVRDVGLPMLRAGLAKGLSLNDAACVALLHLMAVTQDTNLLSRGGLEGWQAALRKVQELLASDPFPSPKQIRILGRSFEKKNLSPGGSADLLGLTLFLHLLCGEV